MHYETLDVELRPRSGGGYEAQVTSGTLGRAREVCTLDLPVESILHLVKSLEDTLWRRRLGRELGTEESPSAQPGREAATGALPMPEELGEALFRSLFHGELARLFESSLAHLEGAMASDGEPRGLRLRFLFDPTDAENSEATIVPWELLRRGATREFLARSLQTPVVRCLDVPRAVRPLRVPGALRVLLVEASPTGPEFLDTAVEARHIQTALEEVAGVKVDLLRNASLQRLNERLPGGGYHVVHFMGHGTFDHDEGEALLCLEDPGGETDPVSAQYVAEHLKQDPRTRLVVLNACATGTLSRDRGRDPFTAAAAACLMAGLPAVVAMQFPISDQAAVAFARGFYGALGRGEPVDSAVALGRLAICDAAPSARRGEILEWITPVLYLRSRDGQLLEPESGRMGLEQGKSASEGAPFTAGRGIDRSTPLRLGIRSMEGLGQGLEEAADRTLSLVEHFDGRWIRDDALWHEVVLPRLRDFLAEGLAADRPLILDLAAHQSLAFAAGSFLEAKSGVEISVVQRGQRGTYEWPARPGEVPEGVPWREPHDVFRNRDARDVAVAVSATWEILDDVALYVDEARLPVRRILHAALPEPGPTAITDGAHALRLAQSLGRVIRRRTPDERRGTVHLFAAAPNALLVFLGQLAPALGRVQLYEYAFDTKEPGAYRPSVRVPAEVAVE